MLGVSHGICYFYGDRIPGDRYRKIEGNWYF